MKNEMGRGEGDRGVAAADRDVWRAVIKAKSLCMTMLSFTFFFSFSKIKTTASVLKQDPNT